MSRNSTELAKMHEGCDEPIIDPKLPIIDAHHHLYDRPSVRYMFQEYLADAAAGHNIVASVYIESLGMARPDGPEVLRPIGEIEFANGIAAMAGSGRYGPCQVAAAIIGHADLAQGDRVAELLDQAVGRAPERFRGVRTPVLEAASDAWLRYVISNHQPVTGVLTSAAFRGGYRHLAPRQLTFDAAVFHNQLPDLGTLASDFPDTIIVLNHMGMAMGMDMDERARMDVFHTWADELRLLAQRPNVVCKVGGLGLPFWGFGLDTRPDVLTYAELARLWEPYVETAIEAFGVDRCIMESNFPPDGRSCGYVPLWNALKHITRGYSGAEKRAMFHDNAARIYRINSKST